MDGKTINLHRVSRIAMPEASLANLKTITSRLRGDDTYDKRIAGTQLSRFQPARTPSKDHVA